MSIVEEKECYVKTRRAKSSELDIDLAHLSLAESRPMTYKINLVSASKVIIFDSFFNRQDDRQAENRALRYG
jgi:hypothetical protein